MDTTLYIVSMVILTLLVFFVDIVLIARFFTLIKQKRYNQYSHFFIIPDFFPRIRNKYIKAILNYITLVIIVFIGAFVIQPRFRLIRRREPFYEKFWYKLLITSVFVILFLGITAILKKMNFIRRQSSGFFYLELIILPLIVIYSLYFFDIAFKWLEKYIFAT